MLYTSCQKGEITLKRRFYQTGQFAKKASVTLRTLRYYDKMGLLSPRQHTESGYRLYAEEARQKMAQRGAWTEEDQKRASAQWIYVASEARRLAEAGADPAGEEAQALARFKSELLHAFTQGDPEIEASLGRFWENFNALPAEEKPFDAAVYSPGEAGTELLEKAMSLYRERQNSGSV